MPRGMPRNTRRMASAPQRQWPPNVLRRVAPVEPPSLAREVVAEVIVPALACAAGCAALAAWLL